MDFVHTPVLPEETIQLLGPRENGELMVDATLGEGGHSHAFLSRFPNLRIIGIDADREIQNIARKRLSLFGDRIEWYTGWSQDFFSQTFPENRQPDTILIDLGISLYHYLNAGRGFSFTRDEPLDMRLDPTRGQTAEDLIAGLSEQALANLIYANAEERYSRRIARSIKAQGRIRSSAVLADAVSRAVPQAYRRGPVHPATKTFLALRIAVNRELESLPSLLEKALISLKPGGRMGVISFHSLEDRIVKNFFREHRKNSPSAPIHKGGIVSLLSRKGIIPGPEEMRNNPRSRSARLRVVEKNVSGIKEGQ
ncbi:MAG: 16S rRNA (cytosine(1402)-N(4))-methyltransferase RsmH [Spirochaetaceae bacterium]|jgi:16S rRNA (cytosine1402-N4)-methyltransferase|nr:16S rRNA (cytosine(1402)-N(4))-methyltransferase RsmH [Spirochaetaceae bacterium]